MSIQSYSKDGKIFYKVYVQSRGRLDPTIRVQKLKTGLSTKSEAAKEERRLIKEVVEEVHRREGVGLKWKDIVERWEISANRGELGDQARNRYYASDHVNRLNRFTEIWMSRTASELTRGDGRKILFLAKEQGIKPRMLKKLKSSISVVYRWAIEMGYVQGTNSTPVEGLVVNDKRERDPQILTFDEVRRLLSEAKRRRHPWFPIWAFAFYTGMRSGELKALTWDDIDLDRNIITVSKSFNAHSKVIKSTKAGYWRNVPIAKDLLEVIKSLRAPHRDLSETVLPRIPNWMHGDAGLILRAFLKEIGVNRYIVLL